MVERAIITITAARISACRLSFRLGTAAVHNSPAAARVAIKRYVRNRQRMYGVATKLCLGCACSKKVGW